MTVCSMTRLKVKVMVMSPYRVGNSAVFKSCLLRHLQRELATDHRLLNLGTIYKFDRTGFLISVLVSGSHDFEVGRNVICEELTISPVRC